MAQYVKIIENFPTLLPDEDFNFWSGTILLENEEVPVTISAHALPFLNNLSLICPIHMEHKILKTLNEFKTIYGGKDCGLLQLLEFWRDQKTSVQQNCDVPINMKSDIALIKLDNLFYNKVLNELKQLGNEHIVRCSKDLSEVILKTVDLRGIEHKLVTSIPREYPNKGPKVLDVDLPHVALLELEKVETVLEMFTTFEALVNSFQDFWNMYDNLALNTWFIDPEHRRFRDIHCRIVIEENVSMLITFNPQDITTCPDIKFLGPNSAIIPFINRMEMKLKTVGWNEEISVFDNLLALLDLSHFPQPNLENDLAKNQDECSICFMARLGDQTLPTRVCNNSKCNSYFHLTCLAQWFQSVPTNETSFNLISGDCPCCGEKILCPIKVT